MQGSDVQTIKESMSFIVKALTPEQFKNLMTETSIEKDLIAQAFFDKSKKLFRYDHVLDDNHDDMPIAYANAIEKANIVISNTKNTDLIDWYFIDDDAFSMRKRVSPSHELTQAIKDFLSLAKEKCNDEQAFKRMLDLV